MAAAKKPKPKKRTRPPARKRDTVAVAHVKATPAAIALAAAHELDLADVVGSGAGGRIVIGDVRAVIAAAAEEPTPIERGGPPTAGNGFVLVSVFGPFNGYALLETSAARATELLGEPLSSTLGPTRVVDATMREIAALEAMKPGIAKTTFAATALALAYELDNPFNSATSKSMCARSLAEVTDRLRALAPEPEEGTVLDKIREKLAAAEADTGAGGK